MGEAVTFRVCFPVQGEAEIVAVHERLRLVQPDFRCGKKLSSDVGWRDSVGVPYFNVQSVRMTEAFHCQMQPDQPGKHQRSSSANADQIDFERFRVKSVFYCMFHFKRSPRVWLADFNNSTGKRPCFFSFRYLIQNPSCPPGCSICCMEWVA